MGKENYARSRCVLCFEGFKNAALYFDRVLPLNLGTMRGDNRTGDVLVGYPEWIPSIALSHLLDGVEGSTDSFFHAERIMDLYANKWYSFAKSINPYASLWREKNHRVSEDYGKWLIGQLRKVSKAYYADQTIEGMPSVREIFRAYAKSVGFEEFNVIIPNSNGSGESCDPSLTLVGLQLIDAESAEWGQVLEIRKDEDSRKKLTRLRLFVSNNYTGCSRSYIEDDISNRLYEYELATKKFGFKTVSSSLTMLLDAKALQASAGTGLIAGLFGGVEVGLTTAAVVELGKVILEVSQKRHEMKNWQNEHELAYLFHAEKNLRSQIQEIS